MRNLPCGNLVLAITALTTTLMPGMKISGLGADVVGYDFSAYPSGALCTGSAYLSRVHSGSADTFGPFYTKDCAGVSTIAGFYNTICLDVWAAYLASVWSSSLSLSIHVDGVDPNPKFLKANWVNISGVTGAPAVDANAQCKVLTSTTFHNTCPTIVNNPSTLTVMDDGTLSLV